MQKWCEISLKSKRLLLTAFLPKDADEIFSCITPTLTRFMGWEPPATKQDFAIVWQRWQPAIENGSELIFVIRMLSDRQFLGMAGLHDAQTATPELGIWIREDFHNKGFGRESVATIIHWASVCLKPTHFIYPVADENIASRRIAESMGGVETHREEKSKYLSVSYSIPSH